MPVYIFLIILLALVSTAGYFRGRKKNKWISGWIGKELEELLKPRDTSYVNIGGTIGYNFVLKLKPPFTEAKGTFTLLPRQSILYFPISLLISRYDRFYMNLFYTGKLLGEGHIVSSDYYRKMRIPIAGEDKLKKDRVFTGGREYLLFWNSPKLGEKLRVYLYSMENPTGLKHFCCYGDNNNFFLFLALKKREDFSSALQAFYKALPSFTVKGAEKDGN